MRFGFLAAVLGVIGLGIPLIASAQKSETAANAVSPSLSARIDGVVGSESKELKIAQLDVEVETQGGLAMTEMTVRFENPGNDTLEGQFAMDLPKGSVITGYALDVGGDMIDGVLQPRDRAREAFERRVVRRIDPGLAEVDFSDRFETRVYPIFPRNGRTIRIRFASPLEADGLYRLPLNTQTVGAYSLRVAGSDAAPGEGVDWTRSGGAWIASGSNTGITGEIAFRSPARDGLTLSEHPGEGTFFEYSGEAPRGDQSTRGPLTILWDRSVSRLDDELAKEAQLAQVLAQRLRAGKVNIVLFDSRASETLRVDPDEVAATLGKVRYAGGTSYSGLGEQLANADGACVLFSDGRATIGDREAFAKSGCRLFAVTSGKEADKGWLEAQARVHGGALVDLNDADGESPIRSLLIAPSFPRVTDGNGEAIAVRILPAPDGRYRMVGPMPQNMMLQVDGRGIPVNRRAVPTFAAPGALWASQKLSLMNDGRSIEEIAEEARRWSVATPGVSFIVLETPWDYADSGFTPPDSYPKALRAEYDRLVAQNEANARQADKAHYNALVAMWDQRKKWWETGKPVPGEEIVLTAQRRDDIPPPPPPMPVNAPPPPVAPPPPAVRTQPMPEEEVRDDIVVTGSPVRNRTERRSVERVTTVDVEESAADASFEVGVEGRSASGDGAVQIVTAEWSADRDYIDDWDKAGSDWADAVARTEKEHGELPLFYLDLAEWHFQNGRKTEALRAAEAALDLPSRDNLTLYIVAQRLLRYGDASRAIWLLDQLTDREAARPHPWMALADAYAKRGRETGNRADTAKALELMSKVAMDRWPGEYQRVNELALAEANALIVALGGADAKEVKLDRKFIAALPLDLRVVAQWNTPRTDLDLWVKEPNGAEIGYSNRNSKAGGRYVHDITQGYGPEEYAIRTAPNGTYRIEANTFAADRRDPNGPSTVTVRLIRDFAKPTQREEVIDVEMRPDGEGRRLIGTIKVD